MTETHEFTGFAWSVQMLNISPALKRTKHSSKLKLKNHSMTKVSHFNLNIFWALVKAQQSLLHNPPLMSLRSWGGGGNFHMKRIWVLVIPPRGCTSEGVQPHNVFSGSFHSTLQGTEPKKTWDCVVLQWVPLRGEKHLKPHPQNRTLILLVGSS